MPEAKFKAKDGYTGKGASNNSVATDSNGFITVPEGVEEDIPF